jgi:hypothetical protein
LTKLSSAETVTPTSADAICESLLRLQKCQRSLERGGIRQRNANARRVRVERNQRFDIVEVVCDQDARERQICKWRFRRPFT